MTDLARIADLEASGRAALPALHEHRAGDWLIRVSGGDTKRVNSANPIAPGAWPIDALATAEQLYRDHGLPCRFRLTPLAHPDADAALADRGYALADRSLTMVVAPAARPIDPAVRLAHASPAEHLDRITALGAHSDADAHARLLANIPGPMAFAVLDEGGPVAAGLASIGLGRAQLADIVVAPAARGRGVGRRLVDGLLGWAAREDCGEAMLQVLADNEPARRLYRSLGFVDAYAYHYRVRT